MQLGALLDKIRDLYLDSFAAAIQAAESEGGDVFVEHALRDAKGKLVVEGELGLGLRIDLLQETEGDELESVAVRPSHRVTFDPVTFDWQGLSVELTSFDWDRLQVEAPELPRTEPLVDWFKRWFDVEDRRDPDEYGFFGVVHYLADPLKDESGTSFEVDMGTAAVTALEDMLDALKACGASKAKLGSVTKTRQ